ncbi:MAG: hypothetical protein HYV09_32140 [Deltaproteobacteria bacterium]|nr:hypothetical protein [Deltaproteobacteria bacterium]
MTPRTIAKLRGALATSVLVAPLAAMAGCRSTQEPSTAYGGGPSVAPTSEISVEDAAIAWAAEACAREKRCGGVGTGTDMPDLATCRARYQALAMERLSGCRSGRIAPAQLDGCTNMVHVSACAVATEGICNLPALCQTTDD